MCEKQFMSGLRHSKLTRIITLFALVLQLGVVAYHHHGDDTAAGKVAAHEYHAHFGHDAAGPVAADHDHPASGEHHHDPLDGEHSDCGLCVLKTAVSGQLIPDGVAMLFAPVQTGERQLVASKETPKLRIALRYHARAPPSEAALS